MQTSAYINERWCRLLGVFFVVLGLLWTSFVAHAQSEQTVLVVPVSGVIDLRLAPYLDRVLQQAEQEQVAAVLLEIDTPGGRLDAALQMRDALLGAPVRTIAFVNREALSAGALIALAADDIYMAPGAVIGAATPVDGAGVTADPKTVSAVRAIFRTTAEVRERDPLIAEAMVDPALVVPDLVEQEQLLTLTTEQAQQVGYSDGLAADRQTALDAAGLGGASFVATAPGLAEQLVRFLTNPAVASLLVAFGLLLVFVDLLTSGFGVIGLVGLGLLALFFWGHMLAGLAGWEGVALVLLGLALLALEAFVIPGFGVAGILGLAALLGGVFISLIGGELVTDEDLARAAMTVAVSLIVLIAGVALLLRFLPRTGRLQGLILQSQVGISEDGPIRPRRRRQWLEGARLEAQMAHSSESQPTEPLSLLGATGVALTALHPGGLAQFGNRRVDVVTQGDYIAAGEPIEVIADEGYRRVVRRVDRND